MTTSMRLLLIGGTALLVSVALSVLLLGRGRGDASASVSAGSLAIAEQGARAMASARPLPFSVVDTAGAPVSEAALVGHPSAMFFGYTTCPDVCPTALSVMSRWLRRLGPDGDTLKVYFVTVDPARDTAERMAAYLKAFDPRIVGLTGTQQQIDGMVRAFKVETRVLPGTNAIDGGVGDYLMDHTALVFLFDSRGAIVGTVDFDLPDELALPRIKAITGLGK